MALQAGSIVKQGKAMGVAHDMMLISDRLVDEVVSLHGGPGLQVLNHFHLAVGPL